MGSIMMGLGHLTLLSINPSKNIYVEDILKKEPTLNREELQELSKKSFEEILLKILKEKKKEEKKDFKFKYLLILLILDYVLSVYT